MIGLKRAAKIPGRIWQISQNEASFITQPESCCKYLSSEDLFSWAVSMVSAIAWAGSFQQIPRRRLSASECSSGIFV
jgi:hypothetical protein